MYKIIITKNSLNLKRASLLYWFPKTRYLSVPQPKTYICRISKKDIEYVLITENNAFVNRLKKCANLLGYPLFMKTDYTSNKYDWLNCPYVTNEVTLIRNLRNIIKYSKRFIEYPINAIILREMLKPKVIFYAFRNMPITIERRYFVRNGKVECHHPYWEESEIRNPSRKDWRYLLRRANIETHDEIQLLSGYAEKISRRLKGYWSLDFYKDINNKWYFIDAAPGSVSWHPYKSLHNKR